MKKLPTICEYCGGDMEAKNKKKRYCSTKCRVAAHRELQENKPSESPKVQIKNLTKPTKSVKPITEKPSANLFVIDTTKKFSFTDLLNIARSGKWNQSYETLPDFLKLNRNQKDQIQSKI